MGVDRTEDAAGGASEPHEVTDPRPRPQASEAPRPSLARVSLERVSLERASLERASAASAPPDRASLDEGGADDAPAAEELLALLSSGDAPENARREAQGDAEPPASSIPPSIPPGAPLPPPSPASVEFTPPAAPRPGPLGPRGPSAPSPIRSAEGPVLPPELSRRRPPRGLPLSPRMIALFGGLFGLATVTSLVALLIQGSAPPSDKPTLGDAPAPSESAAAAAPTASASAPARRERKALPGPFRIRELGKDPGIRIVSGVIDRRSFLVALGEAGVPTDQAYRIMKAFEGQKKFDRLGKYDKFSVALEQGTKKVRGFEFEESPSEIWQARESAEGLLEGAKLDLKVAEEAWPYAFYVGKDVSASAKSAGLEKGALDVIDDAMAGRTSTESFKEGGAVRLVAVEETVLGLFSRYKRVLAVEYRPPDPGEEPTRVYYFSGKEARGYFDGNGRQPDAGGWRSPVPGAPVTSRFNPKRLHPVLKKVMPHNGTDFGAPSGTPVYSAYRGVVELVGFHGPSGNLVTVKHPNGVETGYAHLSRFAPGIKVGDKVGTRQLVGYVGSTGRSTGPHLHFSAKRNGKFFDAESLHLDAIRVMPAVDRDAFAEAKAALDARLDAIPLPEPPARDAPVAAKAEPEGAPAPAEKQAAPPPDPAAAGDEEGEDIPLPSLYEQPKK